MKPNDIAAIVRDVLTLCGLTGAWICDGVIKASSFVFKITRWDEIGREHSCVDTWTGEVVLGHVYNTT